MSHLTALCGGFCLAVHVFLCYSVLVMRLMYSATALFSLPAVVCVAPAAHAAEGAEIERSADSLISTYEDLSNALAGVQDVTDADLVASRVAVDILLIRQLHATLQSAGASSASADFTKSFASRCAVVSDTVDAAMARLKACHCYESDALNAALYLLPLISPEVRPGPDMAPYVAELVANNQEVIIMLLDEAVDASSAPLVAGLVASAMDYGEELAELASSVGTESLSAEHIFFFGQRKKNFELDFAEHKRRLTECKFFDCKELSDLFE